MIDPVDLLLVEHLADGGVDRLRGPEILAERLLQDDAGARRDEVVGLELVGDDLEQFRRGGEIEGAHPVEPIGDQALQRAPAGIASRIDLRVVDAPEEAPERRVVQPLFGDEGAQRLLDQVAEGRAGQVLAGDADDARRIGELIVALAHEQRREQLAVGEIPRAAEHDDVERIDGDDPACHGQLSLA